MQLSDDKVTGAKSRQRERGIALLIVMAALPVLSLLVGTMITTGRADLRMADNELDAARIAAAADGAVREGIFRVITGEWPADGVVHRRSIGGIALDVRVSNENGRINPTLAPPSLLAAVLRGVGVGAQQAATLASRIVDFRSGAPMSAPDGAKLPEYRAAGKAYGPSQTSFQRLDELRLVLGMTSEIYVRLAPHLSVFTGYGIDPASADPIVQAAYQAAGPNGGYPTYHDPANDTPVVRISVDHVVQDPGHFHREAIVKIVTGPPNGEPPFIVVDWQASE